MTMTTLALHSRETWIGVVFGLIITAALPVLMTKIVDAVSPPVTHDAARSIKAMADILAIEEALEEFRREHGRLPTPDEGITALVPDQLERVPMDPWGHAYAYALEADDKARVASYGSDGKPGGEGAAADIVDESGSEDALQRIHSKSIPDMVIRALFFGSVLLLPLVAFRATRHSLAAVGALAGAATVFAVVPLALSAVVLLEGGDRAWILFVILFGIGLLFGVGAIAVLLRVQNAGGAVVAGMTLVAVGLWVLSGMIVR